MASSDARRPQDPAYPLASYSFRRLYCHFRNFPTELAQGFDLGWLEVSAVLVLGQTERLKSWGSEINPSHFQTEALPGRPVPLARSREPARHRPATGRLSICG
jgi:hypothetical protein